MSTDLRKRVSCPGCATCLAEAVAARWPFSWRRWAGCLLSRAGHDWYLTHQRRVTDYYVCRRCGRQRLKIFVREV